MESLRSFPSTNQQATRSTTGTTADLPRPITSFVGRGPEIDALLALVTDPAIQLVTITGPGGVGKTRLAIQAARLAADRFQDGITFVRLADVREPALLPTTIAHALGIHDAIGPTLAERIRDAHGGAQALLVLDNLEHLLDATPFLSDILARCPGITVLATSRHRLHLSGEHVFDLPPLAIEHAIDLFDQRAQAISPGFAITTDSRADIANICAQLDGLPLAIELAAARIPVLPPKAMHARLGNRMSLLDAGTRDAPARHRGIRESIAWSHDLLAPSEQAVFRRLAVFEGGFTLDAAAAVAGSGMDVLAVVSSLEAGSLVKRRSEGQDESRLFMLETIREFAFEQLRDHGEEDEVRQNHAAYFALLVDDCERLWWESGGVTRMDELEPDMPNIRAALSWLQQSGDVPLLLRVAGSLAPLWATRGYSLEGRAFLEWVLPRSDGAPAGDLAVALRALAWILDHHDEYYRMLLVSQHALALAEDIGYARLCVACLMSSGIAAERLGHPEQAMRWYTTAMDIANDHSSATWTPICRCILMNLLGELTFSTGNVDQAEIWYTKMLATQQELGLRFTLAGRANGGLGHIARARGDPVRALGHYQAGLYQAIEVHDIRSVASFLGSIAGALAALGQYETAARLFGASEAYHERIAFPFVSKTFELQRELGLPEPWGSMYPECAEDETLRQALPDRTAKHRAVTLDPDVAQRWWDEGRSLDLDAALALVDGAGASGIDQDGLPGGLSPREIDVLRLLAQGYPNRDIASRLFISPRTVENHVRHILAKLDVSSRSAATAWAIRQGVS